MHDQMLVMWPMTVGICFSRYLDIRCESNPGQVAKKLGDCTAFNQVDFTGNPAHPCRNCTNSDRVRRVYALYATAPGGGPGSGTAVVGGFITILQSRSGSNVPVISGSSR